MAIPAAVTDSRLFRAASGPLVALYRELHVARLDGYDATVAADGPTGYETIRKHTPDVVLLDIGLPGMDGYTVARNVRMELGDRPIRLVALTGYGCAEDHAAVMSAGFDEHLVKPIDPTALARALRK